MRGGRVREEVLAGGARDGGDVLRAVKYAFGIWIWQFTSTYNPPLCHIDMYIYIVILVIWI